MTTKNPRIQREWNEAFSDGSDPVIRYQTGENEYLTVSVELSEEADFILFSFNKKPGSVVLFGDGDGIDTIDETTYSIELDDDYGLWTYWAQIESNIEDGYLLPNGLQY